MRFIWCPPLPGTTLDQHYSRIDDLMIQILDHPRLGYCRSSVSAGCVKRLSSVLRNPELAFTCLDADRVVKAVILVLL